MKEKDFFNNKHWYTEASLIRFCGNDLDKTLYQNIGVKCKEFRKQEELAHTNIITLMFLVPGIDSIELADYRRKTDSVAFDSYNYLVEALQGNVDFELFCKRCKSLPYKDFLRTRYWNIVRSVKKEQAEFKCMICNSSVNLNVHHKTYVNHGNEIFHLDDLVVLCADCHAKFHDKLAEAK